MKVQGTRKVQVIGNKQDWDEQQTKNNNDSLLLENEKYISDTGVTEHKSFFVCAKKARGKSVERWQRK